MHLVEFGPTCNNRCLFCAQASERPSRCPEPNLADTISDRASGQDTVAMVGGEPTIHPHLFDIVAAIRSAGAKPVLQTNARRLAYQPYLHHLLKAGLDAVDVSVAGCTPTMHDYHTCVPGSFHQTTRGVSLAVAAGLCVGVTCIATRSNFRHLDDIVQWVAQTGARLFRLRLATAVVTAPPSIEALVPSPDLIAPYVLSAKRIADQLQIRWIDSDHPNPPLPFVAFLGGNPSRIAPRVVGAAAMTDSCRSQPKPMPGREEQRSAEQRSGPELREILPSLFDTSKPKVP